MKTYSDEELIRGIINRDAGVFNYVYSYFGSRILAYVLKNSGTQVEGEETVQTALLRVWKKLSSGEYQDHGKFDRYFFSVGVNVWRERLKEKKRNKITSLGEQEERLQDEKENTIEQKRDREAAIVSMYEALQVIGSPCEELLDLHYLQEKPLKDIAAEQGIVYNNLRKRIFDCRKKLRKIIEQRQAG